MNINYYDLVFKGLPTDKQRINGEFIAGSKDRKTWTKLISKELRKGVTRKPFRNRGKHFVNSNLPVCTQFRDALMAVEHTQASFAKLCELQTSNLNMIYHLSLVPSELSIQKIQRGFDLLNYKCDVRSWFQVSTAELIQDKIASLPNDVRSQYRAGCKVAPNRKPLDDALKQANVSRNFFCSIAQIPPSQFSGIITGASAYRKIAKRCGPLFQEAFAKLGVFVNLETLFPEHYALKPQDEELDQAFYSHNEGYRFESLDKIEEIAKQQLTNFEYRSIFDFDNYEKTSKRLNKKSKAIDNARQRGFQKLREIKDLIRSELSAD